MGHVAGRGASKYRADACSERRSLGTRVPVTKDTLDSSGENGTRGRRCATLGRTVSKTQTLSGGAAGTW